MLRQKASEIGPTECKNDRGMNGCYSGGSRLSCEQRHFTHSCPFRTLRNEKIDTGRRILPSDFDKPRLDYVDRNARRALSHNPFASRKVARSQAIYEFPEAFGTEFGEQLYIL